jgi:hypothetical protein
MKMKKFIIGIAALACVPFVTKAETKNSINTSIGYAFTTGNYTRCEGLGLQFEYERNFEKKWFSFTAKYNPEIYFEEETFSYHNFLIGPKFTRFATGISDDVLTIAFNPNIGFGFFNYDGYSSDLKAVASAEIELGVKVSKNASIMLAPQVLKYLTKDETVHFNIPFKFKINF